MNYLSPQIDLNDNFDLTHIMSKIQKPLTEIMRLHKMMTEATETNVQLKESSSIVIKNTEQIAEIIERILQIERENEIEIILHNKLKYPHLYLVKSVFDTASDEGAHNLSQEKTIAAQEDIKWLIKLEKIILENIDSAIFNLPHLAEELFVSERQLHRKVKKFTGKSPNKYIRELKLEFAKSQIDKYKYATLSEVAAAVGFKDPHYFSKLYKEKFPSDQVLISA